MRQADTRHSARGQLADIGLEVFLGCIANQPAVKRCIMLQVILETNDHFVYYAPKSKKT